MIFTLLSTSGSSETLETQQALASTNMQTLQTIGIALAATSILADSLALYWFGRASRKLRHDLIVMLLAADLLKSLNTVVFAALDLAGRNIRSTSGYCQASGFFGEYFVEVADFTILAMIVHMSLIVIQPQQNTDGEGGLRRWKPYVFSAVLGVPMIMSSLAFVSPPNGYEVSDAFCQLPLRPIWYRLVLDWLPRYIIVAIIITLTVITWTKVRRLQLKLANLQSEEPILLSPTIEEESTCSTPPSRGRQDSIISPMDKPVLRPASSHVTLHSTASARPLRPASSYTRSLRPASSYTTLSARPALRPASSHPALPTSRERARSLPPSSRDSVYQPSIWDTIDASLPRHSFRLSTVDLAPPPFTSRPTSPRRWASRLSLLSLSRQELSEVDVLTRRQRYITRQLRATLFYPFVYVLLWAGPFALHVYQLITGNEGPLPLAGVAVAEMAAFGAVNALFFGVRERPWKLPRRGGEKWDFKG